MTLKRSYDEIMDRIEVTEEMRRRILKNIERQDVRPEKRGNVRQLRGMRRYLSLAACLAVVLVGALTMPKIFDSQQSGKLGNTIDDTLEMTECSSSEELSRTAGFEIEDIDELPFDAEETEYSYWDGIAEIRYQGGEQSLTYRKSAGTEDNSGDYNEYENVSERTVDGVAVTLKGDGDTCSLAVWQDDGYYYSLSFEQAVQDSVCMDICTQIIE